MRLHMFQHSVLFWFWPQIFCKFESDTTFDWLHGLANRKLFYFQMLLYIEKPAEKIYQYELF